MKIKLFLVLFLTGSLFYGQEQSIDNMLSTYQKDTSDGYSWRHRENSYDTNNSNLSKEKLLSTIWVTDPLQQMQLILVFYKDDFFKIGTRQTGVEIQGNYVINNNTIKLNNYSITNNLISSTGLTQISTDVLLLTNQNDIFYQDYILINGIKYYAVGSEQPNDKNMVYNGIEIVISSGTKVMNDNVKFRKMPNTKGELIQVYQYAEVTNDTITSLKKGTVVELIARTKTEDKIDNISAPWYFIKVFDGFEWFQYGWIFGGYFSDYDKNKDSEYWSIVMKELMK